VTPPATSALDLRGVRVLVVEDHEDSREMLRQIIDSFGATVDAASDGAEGLMMAWENKPDLVFADLGMPTLDGYEFLRRLRNDPRSNAVPVIAVSAHGTDIDVLHTWREGFAGHLVKPVDYEVIAAQLRRALCPPPERKPSEAARKR
jgi:CheY-like chemotaxis protein